MRRLLSSAVGIAALSGSLLLAPAAHADATSDIRINEVQSTSPTDAPDFVELINIGDAPADISGWIIRDNDDAAGVVIPDGTTVAPGGYYVVEPDTGDDGFGLGKTDEARLFAPDGTALIDSYEWTAHVDSAGRIPDGTGAFAPSVPTPGEANTAKESGSGIDDEAPIDSPIVINEVESNGDPLGDWVELANTDQENTVDLSGWTLVDDDASHDPIVLPEGTLIESGGYLTILTEPDFGLGGPDAVTLRDAEGQFVARVAWETHSPTTWARCPDMTGEFGDSAEGTYGLVNNCEDVEAPPVDAEPWPLSATVREAVAPGTWGDDMSGADMTADGTVYAVNNDNGEIFKLVAEDGIYTIEQSWVPTYPDGTGRPDSEGLAIAGDGAIFLATERNNEQNTVSRPSVLRVELGTDSSTTTHEWNLTDITGALGANLGLEAIEWISDADAQRLGVLDGDGQYEPAPFGDHFGGIFVVSVEQTGTLHLVVLGANGDAHLLQSVSTSESVPVVMGLDWRAGGNELWGVCDEACGNRHSVFRFVDGSLTWQANYNPPAEMNPAYTNEGLAIGWCGTDPAATPTVVWLSDTAHNGVSLRVADGAPCVAPDGNDAPAPISEDQLTEETRGGFEIPASAKPGETITVAVPDHAGQSVTVWLHSTPVLLGTVVLDAAGTAEVTIPVDAPAGQHRIVLQAADGSLLGWQAITLTEAGELPAGGLPADGDDSGVGDGAGGDALAETGVNLAWPTAAGLALLLFGGVLVLRTRRRAEGYAGAGQ